MYNSKNARSMRGGFSTLDTVKKPLKYRGVDMNRTGRLVSFKVAVLLTAVMIASCGGGSSGSGGNDLSGDGSNGGQSNPPVLTVPSDAFVFTLDVASTNTVAGSGGTPASCSIAGLPAGLTATVAGNGCAISGTATAPSAQSSYTLSASNDDGTATITIDLSVIIVPPVLAVPSDAFVFSLDVASTNTVAGSGGTPASCSIAGLPAGLTATVAGNGCAISGTATTPLAQSSYILSASNAAGTSTTTIEILIPVDRDANGLIELYTLTQLHNMRYNLSGSSYKTSTADTGSTTGCPNAACNGYELMNDVELDTDGDGQSWTQDSSGNYSLDSGDSAAPYFVIDSSGSGGWQPVGDSANAFNAIFDGNGYVIRNLAIRSELTNIGLFGVTTANASHSQCRV